jgi:hypothetical protein
MKYLNRLTKIFHGRNSNLAGLESEKYAASSAGYRPIKPKKKDLKNLYNVDIARKRNATELMIATKTFLQNKFLVQKKLKTVNWRAAKTTRKVSHPGIPSSNNKINTTT